MKKILFPTDLSKNAENAFLYALGVAEKINAEILALHVYDYPDMKRLKRLPHTLELAYEDIQIEEFENFKDAIPKLREIATENNLSKIRMSHMLLKGDSVRTIVKTSAKEDCDFIIMGTKGFSGLKEMFMGSVTSGVIHNSKKIVLSVPIDVSFDGELDQILFLINYNDNKDIEAMRRVIKFAKQFKESKIHCVHIDDPNRSDGSQILKEMEAQLKPEYEHLDFVSIGTNDRHKTLEEYCDTHKIDIVAILPQRRNLFQRIFFKSRSKKMANHLKVPLMTIPH